MTGELMSFFLLLLFQFGFFCVLMDLYVNKRKLIAMSLLELLLYKKMGESRR